MEVLSDPKLHARGAVMRLEHPALGDAIAYGMGNPIQFSKANAQFDQPAEAIGASNEQIYRGLLKMSAGEVEELRSKGII